MPPWEEEVLSLEKVCTYLAQGRWFRSVRSNGYFGGGRYQYYLGKHFTQCSVAIRFDPDTMTLMCQLEGSEEPIVLPAEAHYESSVDGGTCDPASLTDLSISSPFLSSQLGGSLSMFAI